MERPAGARSRPPAFLAVALAAISALILTATLSDSTSTAKRLSEPSEMASASAGTPIALTAEPDRPSDRDPQDGDSDGRDGSGGDPLDGDPLDGEPLQDTEEPLDQERVEIARSGRPSEEPTTLAAYDDDPTTSWTPVSEGDETWIWLDLGEARRLRAVRWLARGSGTVEVEISSDRQRWWFVDAVDVSRAWDGIELRDDARYIRLSLLRDRGESLPSLAEVAVYGPDASGATAEQEADGDRVRRRDSTGDDDSESEQRARNSDRREQGGRDRISISTEPGETRCKGKKARCQAREGNVSVEENCEQDGSCSIDVRADGGTAICDASGSDAPADSRRDDDADRRDDDSGRREAKRGGDGGRCEAVADGGTVTIGDIN